MMKRTVGRRLGGASVLTLLVALCLLLMEGLALADITVSLYLEIDTGVGSGWDPTAPGPSGVAYNADNNTMFVVDTDRNNYAEFEDDGINIWEITLAGSIVRTGALPFNEPTGVSYDPGTDRLYVSSDSDSAVYEMTWGAGDPFTLREIGIPGGDTEDPVFDPGSGDLFVLEGSGEINRVDLPVGTVLPNPISLDGLGPTNWEGLTITPAGELLVGAENGTEIHVLTTAGAPLQEINMTQIGLDRISGLGVSVPGAGGDGYDIWVADRQDTGSQHGAAQNDGKLWRLSTDGTPPPPTTTTTTTTAATTTTTQTTTTTTAATTTTTQGTTTTTAQGSTTTTVPGSTTTTTIPNPPPPPDPDDPFADDNGSVFENSIEWLAAEGITQGCNPPTNTRFCPDDPVTRGQMAAFLVRANGYSAIGADYFTDDEGNVFENAINKLRTAGVTQGCNPPTNSRYCPDDLVTRGQMAAFLVRAFDLPAYSGPDRFRDDNGNVFEGAIERLAQAGVTLGCNPPSNDRYCPDTFVTRGQMAAFLKRALGE